MSIDRIATAQQIAYFLSQIENAGSALNTTQQQIASGDNSTTYAGFGTQTQVLHATHVGQCAQRRLSRPPPAWPPPRSDCRTPSSPACRAWRPSSTGDHDAVANNDASTLMTQAQSIFDQAERILNSKDANGDYIYSGGKTDTPPVTVIPCRSWRRCRRFPSAFANGNISNPCRWPTARPSPMASPPPDVAQRLMQALQGHRAFRCQVANGNFNGSTNPCRHPEQLPDRRDHRGQYGGQQSQQRHRRRMAMSPISSDDAQTQQSSMATLYSGFVSNIQDTNMAQAATQLSLNQTQLQAALAGHVQAQQVYAAELSAGCLDHRLSRAFSCGSARSAAL